MEIRYTLLTDGSSDRTLIPILTWLLRQYRPEHAIQSEWADLWRLPRKPTLLEDRIEKSVDLYPCDFLFVHRDAENQPMALRLNQIREAAEIASRNAAVPTIISVIPVRMQEAWLLFDVAAIRKAAGNPNGQQPLSLPPLNRVEHLPDPKTILHDLLREASGLGTHRRRKFRPASFAPRVSEFIEDFSPLRTLNAFAALEEELGIALGG